MADMLTAHHASGVPGIGPSRMRSNKCRVETDCWSMNRVWFPICSGLVHDVFHLTDYRPKIRDVQYPRPERGAFVHDELRPDNPRAALRKGFAHDPAKWKQFQIRYRKELRAREERNEALVVKSILEGHRREDEG